MLSWPRSSFTATSDTSPRPPLRRCDRIVYVTFMTRAKTGFDKYVQGRMKAPDFASAYRDARAEIDEIDRLMRQIDGAREHVSLTKADLARRASTPPESVRRLLTGKNSNPTLQTVVRLAGAVGLRVELRPARAPSRRRRAAAHA
jgi:DNA-binding phage protein